MPPWIGMAAVASLLVGSIATAAAARRWLGIDGELARKLVHVAMGLTTAAFPWIFRQRWPVWVLGALALAALAGLRLLPALRRRFGGALHAVERDSWGEFWLPVASVLLWTIAGPDWIRYSLPLVILATADAMAALVGKRYGQARYSSAGGRKSWEGSLAFAVSAFLVVHVPLLLFTEVGRAESLLIAGDMALVLMLVEGLAWEGLDNLFIPVAAMLLLDSWLAAARARLIEDSAAILGLWAFCWWWRARTTLDDSATFACAVLGYVLWVNGGWPWLIAPVTLFALYSRLAPPRDGQRAHRAFIPIAVLLPAMGWLLMERSRPGDARWLIAAAAASACQLSAIILLAHARMRPGASAAWLGARAWALGCALLILPTAALCGTRAAWPAVAAAVGVAPALLGLWWSLPDRRLLPTHDRRWAIQCLMAGAGSLGVLAAPASP